MAPNSNGRPPAVGEDGYQRADTNHCQMATVQVMEVMGRRAHFVERCPQYFIVFEMRIVANKKADAEIKLKLPP